MSDYYINFTGEQLNNILSKTLTIGNQNNLSPLPTAADLTALNVQSTLNMIDDISLASSTTYFDSLTVKTALDTLQSEIDNLDPDENAETTLNKITDWESYLDDDIQYCSAKLIYDTLTGYQTLDNMLQTLDEEPESNLTYINALSVYNALLNKENYNNKKSTIDGSTINNTYFPTTQAVVDYVSKIAPIYETPSAQIEGTVGQLAVDTNNKDVYINFGLDEGDYVWKKVLTEDWKQLITGISLDEEVSLPEKWTDLEIKISASEPTGTLISHQISYRGITESREVVYGDPTTWGFVYTISSSSITITDVTQDSVELSSPSISIYYR